MKIAYLSAFYPFRGGIAQFNALLTEALRKSGHEVMPYTFSRQYPNILFPGKTQFVSENDQAVEIDSIRILDTINPFSYRKTIYEIKKFNPDILLMKYWMSFFAPSLGKVAKKLKNDCCVISILDNVIPHEKKFFDIPLTKYFLKQNHAFISMSKSVQNDLYKLRPNALSELTPHPVYNHFGNKLNKKEACKKLNISQDKKTILFFGFIRKYKGLDLLIKAFNSLNSEYQLLIAGESYTKFDEYQSLIDQNKNKDNIYPFVRYIDDNEVPAFFSAADVLILPYKSATQSGISGIAIHFQLSQIVSNVGGLAEYVDHKKTGLILEQTNPKSIAKSITHFFNNNYKAIFEKNIKEQNDKYSWKTLAQKLITLYNKTQ